jgi:phage tail-like protein
MAIAGSSAMTGGANAAALVSASRFVVDIDASSGIGGQIAFSELGGITSEVEPADYHASSKAGVVLTKQYGKVKPATINLKRGVDSDSSLWAWHNRVVLGDPMARVNCSLMLMNTMNKPQATYQLLNAWPSKLEVSGSKAGSSEVLIATCTLVCDRIILAGGA